MVPTNKSNANITYHKLKRDLSLIASQNKSTMPNRLCSISAKKSKPEQKKYKKRQQPEDDETEVLEFFEEEEEEQDVEVIPPRGHISFAILTLE